MHSSFVYASIRTDKQRTTVMVEKPNYWGTPLSDWKQKNLDPMTQELAQHLLGKTCSVPNCTLPATWDEYCDIHLVQINEAYEEWLDFKRQRQELFGDLNNYFIPYEELE